MDRFHRTLSLPIVLGFALVLAACAVFDPHAEQRAAQARNVVRETPADIRASDGAPTAPTALHRMRLRVYVTARYTAQTIDADRQIRDLVDDANKILGAGVGARLEVDAVRVWEDAGAEDDLPKAVDALASMDSAEGVELVVGMIGAIPRATRSFHDLGMARVLGKHLVVRAASKLEEHEAIDKAFDELSDDTRSRLVRDRKRHRAVAIFLHELGHTLGAPHEVSARSLMYPQYGPTMSAFSGDAMGLMRITIVHRTTEGDAKGALAKELLSYFEKSPGSAWSTAERDGAMAHLRASIAPPPQAAAPARPDPLASLTAEHRAVYERAVEAWQAGDVARAWQAAKPVFDAYPDVFVVQDTRCKMAMSRGVEFSRARAECERVMQLTLTAGPQKP